MNLRLNKIKNPFVILCKYGIIFAITTSFYHQRLGDGQDFIELLIPYRSDYAYAFTGLMYILAVISDLFLSENSYKERKFIFTLSNYHKLVILWIITLILSSSLASIFYGFPFDKFGIAMLRNHILALGVGMSTYYLLKKEGIKFLRLILYSYIQHIT